MKKDVGNCSGEVSRFYYNAEENECFNFTWGGCHGNKNNFIDQRSCQEACSVNSNFTISDVIISDDEYAYESDNSTDYGHGYEYENDTNDGEEKVVDERRRRACNLTFTDTKMNCSESPTNLYYFDPISRACKQVEAYCVQSYNFFFTVDECEQTCGDELMKNGTLEIVPDDTVDNGESI